MTPTEQGWYWWTRTSPVNADARMGDDDWIPSPPGVPVVLYVGLSCATVAFPGCEIDILFLMCCLHGEWGERIPSSDRLEAMREMAAEEWAAEDDCGGSYCVFCSAEPRSELVREYPHPLHGGTAREFRHWIDHAPDCPWLRAQEKPT